MIRENQANRANLRIDNRANRAILEGLLWSLCRDKKSFLFLRVVYMVETQTE